MEMLSQTILLGLRLFFSPVKDRMDEFDRKIKEKTNQVDFDNFIDKWFKKLEKKVEEKYDNRY